MHRLMPMWRTVCKTGLTRALSSTCETVGLFFVPLMTRCSEYNLHLRDFNNWWTWIMWQLLTHFIVNFGRFQCKFKDGFLIFFSQYGSLSFLILRSKYLSLKCPQICNAEAFKLFSPFLTVQLEYYCINLCLVWSVSMMIMLLFFILKVLIIVGIKLFILK